MLSTVQLRYVLIHTVFINNFQWLSDNVTILIQTIYQYPFLLLYIHKCMYVYSLSGVCMHVIVCMYSGTLIIWGKGVRIYQIVCKFELPYTYIQSFTQLL